MASAGKPASTSLFQDGTYNIDKFHDTFIEIGDPTEYKAALELVGSWREWQRLKHQSTWFMEHVESWLDELEVKQSSDAIDIIQKAADSSDKASFQAAKWLAERKYKQHGSKGRPSNAAIKSEIAAVAQKVTASEEEAKRVIKGVISLDKRRNS